MTKNYSTTLGIFLAVVMLCGSVPLGFSEPLRVQLEQGIETSDIQCDNSDHVLVQRTNGKLACVFERNAEKMSWEIINNVQLSGISYEYPIYAGNTVSDDTVKVLGSSAVDSSLGDLKVSLSNIPKIGETADIEIEFTIDVDFPEWEEIKDDVTPLMGNYLTLHGGLEFIDEPDVIDDSTEKWGTKYILDNEIPLMSHGDTITLSAQVIAVESGVAKINYSIGGGGHSNSEHFKLYLGDQESLLYSDYVETYGEPPIEAVQSSDEPILTEREIMELIYKQILEGTYEGNDADQYINSNPIPASEVPIEEMRKLLKSNGLTDDEIETELDRIYSRVSTQSFSILPKAFAQTPSVNVSTKLTFDDLPISPDTDNSVHDVKTCVNEYDFIRGTFQEIKCGYTNSNGFYYFTNIVPSGSDGRIDFYISYATDGRHSLIAQSHPTQVLGNPYERISTIANAVTFDVYVPTELDTTRGQADYDNAFWIADAIGDAHDRVDTVFDERINKVNVAWQHNADKTAFDSTQEVGGAYYCPDQLRFRNVCNNAQTIFLDGHNDDTTSTANKDHSYHRWTLLHEYGHHVMTGFLGASDIPSGCSHEWGNFYDTEDNTLLPEGCMWGEGFANSIPSLVDDSERYEKRNGNWVNLEESVYSSFFGFRQHDFPLIHNDNESGQISELAIAGSIWDMYDDNDHNPKDYRDNVLKDNIEADMELFGEIMDDAEPVTIEEFYDNWQIHSSTTDVQSIMSLHHMAFANSPPTITPISDKVINANQKSLTFVVNAQDPDNDPLTFSILYNTPSGATIGETSGVFRWTPTESQVGTHYARIVVSDGATNISETVKITVQDYFDPEIRITSPTTGTHYNTNNNQVTLGGTSYDNEDVQSIRFELNGVHIGTITSNLDNWTFGPFTVSRSSNTLHAIAEDTAGNTELDELFILYSDPRNNSPSKAIKPIPTFISPTSVTLNWSAPVSIPDIDWYDIFRSSSPKELIATVPHDQLTYTDNDVSPSTTYTYTISAKNDFGNGEESDPITITTLSDTERPVITINPPNPVTLTQGDIYSESGASCTDDIDGNISNVAIVSNVDVTTVGTYQVTYDCQDAAGNNAVQKTRTVNVVIPHVPPVLSSISDVTVNEGQVKSFTVSATDQNNDSITYSLSNSPAWVSISGDTITVSTPNELPNISYSATVTATDNDGTDTESFRININEINQAPLLNNISDVESDSGQLISFTVTASDSDIPAQSLSFSMAGNPVGAVMDGTTGVFTWTPNDSQIGTHIITFTVTDNGSPTKSDSQDVTFTITAIADTTPPIITVSPAEITLNLGTPAPDLLDGVSTDDNSPVTTTGTVDVSAIGTYTITYASVDASGNQADQKTRTYIIDDIPPQSLLNNTFDDSLDGWQEYSFTGTSSSSTTFENYDLTLDSTTGMPSPSAHISGDGFVSNSGIYKTVNISSIDNNSPLYLSFDYRATSSFPDVILTNTHLEVYDEVTGETLHNESLIAGGTRDSGWQRYSTDISSITSGYDSIKIVLYVSDRAYGDFGQQNWYDNITLGTQNQQMTPIGQQPRTGSDDDSLPLSVTITTQPITTSNESFVFSGTSVNADIVALYIDGRHAGFTTTPDNDGNWSFTVELEIGENVLGVVAVNDDDMVSPVDITVTLDTTIPPAINQPSQITTSDDSLTLTGIAQAGSIVILNHNNIQLEPVTVDTDGTWSFTVILSEGNNVFYAVTTDEAGNQSVISEPIVIILDTA